MVPGGKRGYPPIIELARLKEVKIDMWISELLNFIFALFRGKRK